MTETPHLSLPLLSPSQAQKHVTVNEALARLDGLVQLRLSSLTESSPPASFGDGEAYGVPAGASGDWAGQDGMIAHSINGGWAFVAPQKGFRAVVLDTGQPALHDGTGWVAGAVTFGATGSGLTLRTVEFDVTVLSGASVITADVIPERAFVFGVTGRVIAEIAGASGWRLGVSGDDGRYGTGLGTSVNSWLSGPSTPLVYWSDTPLVITAEGPNFSAGAIRLAIHYGLLTLPAPV